MSDESIMTGLGIATESGVVTTKTRRQFWLCWEHWQETRGGRGSASLHSGMASFCCCCKNRGRTSQDFCRRRRTSARRPRWHQRKTTTGGSPTRAEKSSARRRSCEDTVTRMGQKGCVLSVRTRMVLCANNGRRSNTSSKSCGKLDGTGEWN